jgi:iron complex outermembrane recepter protein
VRGGSVGRECAGRRRGQSSEVGARTDQAGSGLEDIIVSARKVQESSRKVPVIENIISARQLSQLLVTDVMDLPTLAPGLNVGQLPGATGDQVAIRGVGAVAISETVDQSVALNIDDVQMGSGLAFQIGSFDLGQIEVLKGPQSLFYGKSTTAGVIALRTADPTSKAELIGQTEYEAVGQTFRETAIVSGPVSSTLKARLAVQYSAGDGYFKNGVTDILPGTGAAFPQTPHSSNLMIRGTVLWDPSDTLSVRLKSNYMDGHSVNSFAAGQSDCPGGTSGVPPTFIPILGGNNTCRLGRTTYVVALDPTAFPGVPNGGYPFNDNYIRVHSLDATYRPTDALSVSSTTGYYSIKTEDLTNATDTSFAAGPIAGVGHFRRRSLTEEVRLTSQVTSPLNYMLGDFFEDGRLTETGGTFGNTALGLPPILQDTSSDIDIRTYSAFAQLRYRVIPELELAAGVPWTDETRKQDPFDYLAGMPLPGQTPSINSKKFMPDFTATYTPTDDLTVFAAYRVGFKSGSFGMPVPFRNNAFGDEQARGGELGIKSPVRSAAGDQRRRLFIQLLRIAGWRRQSR